jgi:DNA-binding MarR family transcriptional regulator
MSRKRPTPELDTRSSAKVRSKPLRGQHVETVLTAVVGLNRHLTAARQVPFRGRRLRRSHIDALFVLAHRPTPVTPGSLASALGVTAGAVTQLLETLAAAGLVESDLNPHDGRSRILKLTESSRAEIAEFEQQVVADLTPRFDALTDTQLAALADLLDRLEVP